MCISSCSISIIPDQQSFIAIPDDSTVDISDALGSDTFRVMIDVVNTGPSNSRFATLTIYWPFMDPDETNQFFLYPTRIGHVSYKVIDMYMITCIHYRIRLLHVVWNISIPSI